MNAYIHKYLINPLGALLAQGITPSRLALSLASGVTIGIFPIVGTTTAICTMAAIAFRMNLLVIQLGNWIVYPLQFALIVPFLILGEKLFGSTSNLSPAHVANLMRADIMLAVRTVSQMILHGALAWALCAPLVLLLSYAVILPLIRILHSRVTSGRPS